MRWFVVHTHARMEAIAAANLGRLGFETYLPLFSKRRSHAGRVDQISAPLFPRYIFVALNPDQGGWRVIRSTRGAIDVVRFGNELAAVSKALLEDIRAREDSTGHVVLARQFAPKPGDRVNIQKGAFAKQAAIFTAMTDNMRVTTLLSLLGREFSVSIPIDHIAPTT
jgi:transcriptional antiterminator RfaH